MSSVPYIFANQTGNIALSDLDANFANVKANVDYANTAAVSITVTASAQPNITSVGSTLSVSGNINAGNVRSTGLASITGNITSAANIAGGNIIATSTVSAVSYIGNTISITGNINSSGNITGGNLLTGGVISSTGNITSDANVSAATVLGSVVSASGNVTGGNIITSGRVQATGLSVVGVNYANVTANATTVSLSTTVTRNILIANNTGYTTTINMPSSPVDGQLTTFSISGNTMTLVAGTGNITPSFAGSAPAGTAFTYVFRNSNTIWYRTN